MARAIWTGTISFGLVSVPVALFSATEDHTIHFHQFERDTSDRIRNQRVNERTGKEVDFADIVKGTEVGDGEYVLVGPEELDSIAPGRSRSLEISDFVDLDEIDPIYFNRTYWLAPANDQGGQPYYLLLEAMRRTNRAAIGTFVMRGKQYLVAVRPDRDVLAMETLFFADEVRDPAKELDSLPVRGKAKDKELQMATQLIESMADEWRPDRYRDTYRDRVAKLIEDKHRGREIVTEAEPSPATEVSDLLDALRRSVDAASGRKSPTKSGHKHDDQQRNATDGKSKTKAELAERARELDIPGRSRMNRAELAAAIEHAQLGGPAKKRAS